MEKPSVPASAQATVSTTLTGNIGRFVLVGIVAGLSIGALTAAGQSVIRGDLWQLTNSGAIWVIITFVMGRYASSRITAIVAGTLALCGEFLGYYVTVWLISPYVSPLWRILAWCAVAVIAGPLFSWGGYISRHLSGRMRLIGLAMLGAVFIGEGLYLIAWLSTPVIFILWLAIGAVITAILTRQEIQRAQAWAMTAILGLLFYGSIEALTLLNMIRKAIFEG